MKMVSSLLFLATALLHAVLALPNPGDPCTVQYPQTCGQSVLVDEAVTQTDRYGPNVCIYNQTYEVMAYSYAYRQLVCFRRFCMPPVCSPTTKCDRLLNITVSRVACCQGYAASASLDDDDFGFEFEYGPHGDRSRINRGCPIVLRKNVFDCLGAQNLSDFKLLLSSVPSLTTLLSDTTRRFTILAVVNNSSPNLFDELLAADDSIRSKAALSRQIINGTVPRRYLSHGRVYPSLLSSDNIHVTEVYSQWHAMRRVFVDGVQILNSDACLATNGIVHIVNGFVPTASGSIANILRARSEFGVFNALVQAAGVTWYLEFLSPKTVFAPTNSSFPAGFLDCLKLPRNRQALLYVVLLHITWPAEYTSTLSLRTVVGTAARVNLRVQSAPNGTVYLTKNRTPITKPDIQATNGVVHGISQVILGEIDYKTLCPAASPTTTPQPLLPAIAGGAMETVVRNLGNDFPTALGSAV